LGGYEHDLPIIVFACIEELYRTGLWLRFTRPPSPLITHPSSIQAYIKNPSGPFRTAHASSTLSTPSTRSRALACTPHCTLNRCRTCALLSTYLSSPPEPVLSSALFEAVWAWCMWPSLEREGKVEQLFSTRDEERENEARSASPVAVEDEDEATQISLARRLICALACCRPLALQHGSPSVLTSQLRLTASSW